MLYSGKKNIYLAGMFLAFHYVLTIYINSSMLKSLFSDTELNIFYIIASLISILIFVCIPKILNRFGVLTFFIIISLLELSATYSLGMSLPKSLVVTLFVIHQALSPIIFFNLDLFLEHETKNEENTGETRGAFLSFQSIAWVVSPFIASNLAPTGEFSTVYIVSSILILPMIAFILFKYKNYRSIKPSGHALFGSLKNIFRHRDIRRVLISNTILQFFYATMVIYLPLLLVKVIGFSWSETGIILTIMLLPFLLLEYPIGYLADKKFGEKEIMLAGFLITVFFTILVFRTHSPIFILWSFILFCSRIGASMIEISNESFFFKHVKDKDSDVIGLFRITRPLAYVLAPLVAIPVLKFTNYSGLFLILSIITASGLLFIPKKDTK
jgi:MFS family permease